MWAEITLFRDFNLLLSNVQERSEVKVAIMGYRVLLIFRQGVLLNIARVKMCYLGAKKKRKKERKKKKQVVKKRQKDSRPFI